MSPHPLDRLTTEEIAHNRTVLDKAGLVGPSTRFPLVMLVEPAKSEVLAWPDGGPVDRRVQTVLLDRETGAVEEVVVSLTDEVVVSQRSVDVVREGQPPIMGEEFELVEKVLWSDEGWCAAMALRGLTTPERIRVSALSAGCFDLPGEEGRRLVRCLSFLQLDDSDNVWAHPIDGLVAYVDLITAEVVELVDEGVFPLPTERADFQRADGTLPARTTQKPIEITQPEGPSLHGRGQRGALGEVGVPDRLRPGRGPDPAPDRLRGRRPRPADRLPGLGGRDGGAVRRPVAGPLLAELLRRGRVLRSARRRTRWSWAATASARSTTSTPPSPTTTATRG